MKEALKTLGKAWVVMWVTYGISVASKETFENMVKAKNNEIVPGPSWVPIETCKNVKAIVEAIKKI